MKLTSDTRLWALIQVCNRKPNYRLTAKFWEDISSCLEELRKDREENKKAREWVEMCKEVKR